ncbi:ferric reductase-like protein transmembrane component 4 [Ophiobolus disseminans]|uniref:Ferric reductase-like protein transmembrane component 4 n=1 Tax=Ophiobolus disseminans TaxID=1469910 RepID=A0A6A6ZFR6_9PLEO|nr:ferric reductase-like protein transmembrane component 4 [Ophiobolus disseminans]
MLKPRIFLLSALIAVAHADGTGLIGYGKTLYNPTCTFAYRSVIRKQTLSYTPSSSMENHGTAHNPVSTPPKCFVQDAVFLKTMALCIDVYCSLSDGPKKALVEDYWAGHLGTGTLGDYQYVPVLSYDEALAGARRDEDAARERNATKPIAASVPKGLVPYKISSPLAITTGGSGALNSTRLVSPVQWQLQYNYLSDFEVNEKGHSTMAITIALVAILLPIALSLLRFVPGLAASHRWNRLKSILVHPSTLGKHHREPVAGGVIPTRGQSLYILLISLLNLILLVAPYTITQPQASFTTRGRQLTSIIGNRAGSMAMGNVVALFLFSSRNSVLMYITDWSYGTYLLLHRWLGYWAVIHTIIHSAMLWSYYVKVGTYSAEVLRLYWVWGIVATVAMCAIIPFSLLKLRQKFYEFFIVSHIALSLLFLVAYYYHIWYVYTYNWGYEIWMFAAAGMWAVERLVRVGRMALRGSSTTVVSVVPDTDGEYIQLEVEGKDFKAGVAYLCFPTLSWRFWETHPFSVSDAIPYSQQSALHPTPSLSTSDQSPTLNSADEKGATIHATASTVVSDAEIPARHHSTLFFARARSGVTKALTARASTSSSHQVRLRVLIDGPYNHSGRVESQIAQCSSVLCIAGGVGITACLPLLKQGGTKDSKLFWSSRKPGLINALKPTLTALATNVKVETLVGQRFDINAILRQELVDHDGVHVGPLAILVSGPPGLADDVRYEVTRIAGSEKQSRAYVLIDEAFGW